MARMAPPTDEERKARDFTIPAGRYVLGFTWFQRKSTERPPYIDSINAKFVSVKRDGSNGKGFRTRIGICIDAKGDPSLEKRVAFNRGRWGMWMDLLGITEAFEIGETSERTDQEGDRNIARLFVGRAFVANVDRTERNGYTNNEIRSFVFPKQWTPEEAEAIRLWEERQANAAAARGRPEDSAPDDDIDRVDDPGYRGGSDDDSEPAVSPPVDDDPFSW